MSWISDTKSEINKLDLSKKSLRKFGITVGLVFVLLFSFFFFFSTDLKYSYIFILVGIPLLLLGFFAPKVLENLYKIWMGIAFALGWIVSRIILTILFYLVILPIGFIARLFGKDFLSIKINSSEETYWIAKKRENKVNYLRMH